MLINNDTYQRETLSERTVRQPLKKGENESSYKKILLKILKMCQL